LCWYSTTGAVYALRFATIVAVPCVCCVFFFFYGQASVACGCTTFGTHGVDLYVFITGGCPRALPLPGACSMLPFSVVALRVHAVLLPWFCHYYAPWNLTRYVYRAGRTWRNQTLYCVVLAFWTPAWIVVYRWNLCLVAGERSSRLYGTAFTVCDVAVVPPCRAFCHRCSSSLHSTLLRALFRCVITHSTSLEPLPAWNIMGAIIMVFCSVPRFVTTVRLFETIIPAYALHRLRQFCFVSARVNLLYRCSVAFVR